MNLESLKLDIILIALFILVLFVPIALLTGALGYVRFVSILNASPIIMIAGVLLHLDNLIIFFRRRKQ